MNGIPAIGINIHTPGTEAFEDVGIDILSGKRFDLAVLEYIPDIKNSPGGDGSDRRAYGETAGNRDRW